MPFAATRMDLENLILREVSQVEKDKYHMMSLTRGNWKKATHELLNTYIFLKTKIELQM